MPQQMRLAPAGATHYCEPYYYRISHGVVFKYDRQAWTPSLFDAKTLTLEPDCKRIR